MVYNTVQYSVQYTKVIPKIPVIPVILFSSKVFMLIKFLALEHISKNTDQTHNTIKPNQNKLNQTHNTIKPNQSKLNQTYNTLKPNQSKLNQTRNTLKPNQSKLNQTYNTL